MYHELAPLAIIFHMVYHIHEKAAILKIYILARASKELLLIIPVIHK